MSLGGRARAMPRRRLTLAAFVGRRWRAIGAILVLLLGSLLVLAVTDRGHDPIWTAAAGEVDQTALSPDGLSVYALARRNGSITGLRAHSGETGELLWMSEFNATRALLAAGPTGAAVATDFPRAFLTFYGVDGGLRWQVPLEGGSPVALRIEGERVVLALEGSNNPVLLFDGDLLIRTYRFPGPVRALDLQEGLLATGGLGGEVIVLGPDHREVLSTRLNMSIRSLRLAQDGSSLVVGGFGLTPADPRGRVALLDIGSSRPVRWEQETPVGVGLVDTDAAGLFVLAVEDEPPSATLHVYEGATGATLWTRLLRGSVARDDAGTIGGAALSPDGSVVAVSTLRGGLTVFGTEDGDEGWRFDSHGGAIVTFAQEDARRLLFAGRLLESRPFDTLLLFSPQAEPLAQRAGLLGAALVAGAGLVLGLYVGVGFWRARRPY